MDLRKQEISLISHLLNKHFRSVKDLSVSLILEEIQAGLPTKYLASREFVPGFRV